MPAELRAEHMGQASSGPLLAPVLHLVWPRLGVVALAPLPQ